MRKLLIILIVNCLCSFAFANDADTIVTRSGKTYIGIAHHQTEKTISITAFSLGDFNNVTFNIVRDSIAKLSIDSKQGDARQLLERGGVYKSSDTTKQGLKSNNVIELKNKGYWVALNTDIINLVTANPYLSLELFRRKLNGTSLVIGFTYDLQRGALSNKEIYSFKQIGGNYISNVSIQKSYYSLNFGIKKYFGNSKIGAFYFNPQFVYSLHDVDIKTTSKYYNYTYNFSNVTEFTGLAFDGSLGYCFYRSQYILLNIDIGFKALSLPDGVTNFYLKNGIELGVAF
jgi:hypothetical protein